MGNLRAVVDIETILTDEIISPGEILYLLNFNNNFSIFAGNGISFSENYVSCGERGASPRD